MQLVIPLLRRCLGWIIRPSVRPRYLYVSEGGGKAMGYEDYVPMGVVVGGGPWSVCTVRTLADASPVIERPRMALTEGEERTHEL